MLLLELLPTSLNHVFPTVVSALLFIVAMACLYKLSSSRFSKMKLPPRPKPLQVLRNIHQLSGGPLHAVLHDFYKAYGPICYVKAGVLSIVSVTSSTVAKEIFKSQEQMFMQRPRLPIFEMIRFDRGSITFCPSGDYWKEMRKLCVMESLSPGRVRHFQSLRTKEIASLAESVKCTFGLPFDISKTIFACANRVISNAALGQDCKRQDEFISVVKDQQSLAGQFSIPEIFPSVHFLYHIGRTKAKLSRFRSIYDDILRSIIADRRLSVNSHFHSSSDEENFVDVLLRLQASSKSLSINDNKMKDIILDMLIAGTDTWPTTVEWTMSELLKNPGIMKKAKIELQDALMGRDIIKEEDLDKCQYLKQIVKETFRLHPPGAMVGRINGEDCVVHGYDIPKGSRVLINTWSMGRDPNTWENPAKYDPERNLDSSMDLIGKYFEILPFGSGKRVCAGAGFEVAGIEFVLANLICCFDWELAWTGTRRTRHVRGTRDGNQKVESLVCCSYSTPDNSLNVNIPENNVYVFAVHLVFPHRMPFTPLAVSA